MNKETLEKIRKILYKNNPNAKLCYITKNGMVYVAEFEKMAIMFVIPLDDLGDAKFSINMESKLMSRWINTVNEITDN